MNHVGCVHCKVFDVLSLKRKALPSGRRHITPVYQSGNIRIGKHEGENAFKIPKWRLYDVISNENEAKYEAIKGQILESSTFDYGMEYDENFTRKIRSHQKWINMVNMDQYGKIQVKADL